MTVKECIQYYKDKYKGSSSRISTFWMCPSIAIRPRVGTEYSMEFSYNSTVPEIVEDVEVTKHWKENNTVCIIFRNTEELEAKLYK